MREVLKGQVRCLEPLLTSPTGGVLLSIHSVSLLHAAKREILLRYSPAKPL